MTMNIRTGVKRNEIPAPFKNTAHVPKRSILFDFLESGDEAWEIIPDMENGYSLYSSFRMSIQTEPTLLKNCWAVWRSGKIFIVRVR